MHIRYCLFCFQACLWVWMLYLDLFRQYFLSNSSCSFRCKTHIPRRKTWSEVTNTKRYTISCFLLYRHMVFHFSRTWTISTALILFTIPSYIFLRAQIRIKLVKLTMQWPKSSLSHSSFSHLAFSQSSEGKHVSYSSYGKICNLCLPVYERVFG